jgi:hypothetical protein
VADNQNTRGDPGVMLLLLLSAVRPSVEHIFNLWLSNRKSRQDEKLFHRKIPGPFARCGQPEQAKSGQTSLAEAASHADHVPNPEVPARVTSLEAL